MNQLETVTFPPPPHDSYSLFELISYLVGPFLLILWVTLIISSSYVRIKKDRYFLKLTLLKIVIAIVSFIILQFLVSLISSPYDYYASSSILKFRCPDYIENILTKFDPFAYEHCGSFGLVDLLKSYINNSPVILFYISFHYLLACQFLYFFQKKKSQK